MTDHPQRRSNGPGNGKPGWMSIPGGPKEPRWDDFISKVQTLNSEKTKMFDSIKELNAKLGNRSEKTPVDAERSEIRGRMDALRNLQNEGRKEQNDKRTAMKMARGEKIEAERKLALLTDELGTFHSVEEIDRAIEYIMNRMETGGGSLSTERKTLQRVNKLEQAKSLLLNLQPMQDAIEESDVKERELQQEFREIHERMLQVNKDFATTLEQKKTIDSANNATFDERRKVMDERAAISKRINEIMDKTKEMREQFDADRAAWDEWKVEAMAKYNEKMNAERAEREAKWKDREEAKRNERKKEKIAKRRNPYEQHISTCGTLVRYLRDKKIMARREEEERDRRSQTANFNPEVTAPTGFELAPPITQEICTGKKKSTAAKRKEKAKAAAKEAAAKPTSSNQKDSKRHISHSAEKIRQFKLVQVEAPSALDQFDKTIDILMGKKKDYESHIVSGPIDVSSSDEEEEEDAEAAAAAKAQAEKEAAEKAQAEKEAAEAQAEKEAAEAQAEKEAAEAQAEKEAAEAEAEKTPEKVAQVEEEDPSSPVEEF